MRLYHDLAKRPERLLFIFIGAVFITAAVFRIFNLDAGRLELAGLFLPGFLVYFIILIELAFGFMFLLGLYERYATVAALAFVTATVVHSLILGGSELLGRVGELFVMDVNPTDIFLHLTYAVILAYLLIRSHAAKKIA